MGRDIWSTPSCILKAGWAGLLRCSPLQPSSCGYLPLSIHVLSLFLQISPQGHVVTHDLFCSENWPSTPVATWSPISGTFSQLFLFLSSCGLQHALYRPIWELCLSRHIRGCYLGCSISPDFISFPSPYESVKMSRVTAELLRIPVKQKWIYSTIWLLPGLSLLGSAYWRVPQWIGNSLPSNVLLRQQGNRINSIIVAS